MDASFQPITTHAERRGNQVRVYCEPQFVRPPGGWQPIEELVQIADDPARQAFRVSFGQEWVELRPAEPLACLREMRRRSRRFGWLLEAAEAPDAVRWDVAASPGCRHVAEGWVLAEVDGVPIGLFIADWRAMFGPGCRIESQETPEAPWRVSLDLTCLPAELRDRGGLIDLDPTMVQLAGWIGARRWDPDGWVSCRNAAESSILHSGLFRCEAEGVGAWRYITRVCMKFDTSAYPASRVTAATFYVRYEYGTAEGGPGSSENVYLCAPTFAGAEWVKADYGAVKPGYESAGVGYLPDVPWDQWASKEILPVYAAGANFGLALVHKYDKTGVDPVGHPYEEDFYMNPYLELTVDPTPLVGNGGIDSAARLRARVTAEPRLEAGCDVATRLRATLTDPLGAV